MDFVLGNYKNTQWTRMIPKMTAEEKLLLLNVEDYSYLYKHLGFMPPSNLNSKYSPPHIKRYLQGQKNYLSCITNSRNTMLHYIKKPSSKEYSLLWEIPKGKINKNESEFECAVREFGEETNIRRDQYTIYSDVAPIHYSFQEDDKMYSMQYLLAEINNPILHIAVDLTNRQQTSEVIDIQWFNINQIKLMNNHRLSRISSTVLAKYKKRKNM